MKVTLNIESDEELRQHIKNAIDGQVRGIVRAEIAKVVVDEVARALPSFVSNWSFTRKSDDLLEKAINQIVNKHAAELGFSNTFISELINKKLDAALAGKDWKAIVDAIAKEKIKAMLG